MCSPGAVQPVVGLDIVVVVGHVGVSQSVPVRLVLVVRLMFVVDVGGELAVYQRYELVVLLRLVVAVFVQSCH